MNVPVRFTRTQDGCGIAYTVAGTGSPIVYVQPYSHQQIEQTYPVLAEWYRRLSRYHTLVRLDPGGFGLSERRPGPMSFESFSADVGAVVDHLGLETFSLVGVSGQGHTAIRYAADHPGRVSRLVTWATPSAGFSGGRTSSILAMWDLHDVELTLDAQARWIAGDDTEQLSMWSRYVRACVDPGALFEYHSLLVKAVPVEVFGAVRCPSLAIYPSLHGQIEMKDVRDLALKLPNCEFAIVDGRVYPHIGPNTEANAELIERFVEGTAEFGPAASGGGILASQPGGVAPERLSSREIEVLRLLVSGLSNRDIAAALVLGEPTVATHLRHIYQKTHTANRTDAVAFALRSGIA